MPNFIDTIINNLSVAEAIESSKTLILFIIGMVFYSIFIFKFYHFLATRDVFKLNLAKYSRSKWEDIKDVFVFLFYVLEHIIIFPLFVLFWFLVLSTLLLFLSEGKDVNLILISAMSVVATVRITSYYSEELSREIAKTLPLTLLGVFLVAGISSFSIQNISTIIDSLPSLWKIILYYLLFLAVMEILLRALFFIYNLIRFKDK